MRRFQIQPGHGDWADGQQRIRLLLHHNANQASVWDLTQQEELALFHVLEDHLAARHGRATASQAADHQAHETDVAMSDSRLAAKLARGYYQHGQGRCPCVCNSGGFCGGCGHAGCGRR